MKARQNSTKHIRRASLDEELQHSVSGAEAAKYTAINFLMHSAIGTLRPNTAAECARATTCHHKLLTRRHDGHSFTPSSHGR